jgi:hypothetical protein
MSALTIRESRQLVLPLQTVVDAVLQLERRDNGPLANTEFVQAEFVRGNPRDEGLDIAVRSPDHNFIEWRHFDLEALARAIIAFFRAQRIPLPFGGSKTLSIGADGVSFSIENTVDVKPRAAVDADLAGRPLRYAKGYEPYALTPNSKTESCV